MTKAVGVLALGFGILVLAGCSAYEPQPSEPKAAPELPYEDIEYADCLWIASSLEVITENLKNGDESLVQIGFELLAEDASRSSGNYSGEMRSLLSSLAAASASHASSIANGGDLNSGETFDRFREAFVALDPYC